MPKVNPFRPNSPVAPGMFVGRIEEVQVLEQALVQTRAGRSKSFMITGERGIGKTSLLLYTAGLARGELTLNGDRFNFLVVETDIDRNTTQLGLVKKIELRLVTSSVSQRKHAPF